MLAYHWLGVPELNDCLPIGVSVLATLEPFSQPTALGGATSHSRMHTRNLSLSWGFIAILTMRFQYSELFRIISPKSSTHLRLIPFTPGSTRLVRQPESATAFCCGSSSRSSSCRHQRGSSSDLPDSHPIFISYPCIGPSAITRACRLIIYLLAAENAMNGLNTMNTACANFANM